jgi:hypothetical protein
MLSCHRRCRCRSQRRCSASTSSPARPPPWYSFCRRMIPTIRTMTMGSPPGPGGLLCPRPDAVGCLVLCPGPRPRSWARGHPHPQWYCCRTPCWRTSFFLWQQRQQQWWQWGRGGGGMEVCCGRWRVKIKNPSGRADFLLARQLKLTC